MKRRRWWLIALSLALLAACVAVWRWSGRPPYRFMTEGTLWFEGEMRPGSQWTIFTLDQPLAQVVRSAEKELGLQADPDHSAIFEPIRGRFVHIVTPDHIDQPSPPLPRSAKTVVIVIRKRGYWDWFSSFRFDHYQFGYGEPLH